MSNKNLIDVAHSLIADIRKEGVETVMMALARGDERYTVVVSADDEYGLDTCFTLLVTIAKVMIQMCNEHDKSFIEEWLEAVNKHFSEDKGMLRIYKPID